MGRLTKIANRLFGRAGDATRAITKPASGQIVVPDQRLDAFRQAVSDGLTFSKMRSLLKAADSGNLADTLSLFEEMEQKDGDLRSVASTRRRALTGLPWEIVSAADVEDVAERNLADEAADYCREQITKLKSFKRALKHTSKGIGTNLAVLELVWEDNRIVDLVRVPHWRLRIDPREPSVIRVITGEDYEGIPTVDAKWVVHSPEPTCGFPLAQSLFAASAFSYLAKALSLADWAVYCEIFGMPIRVAKYQPGATNAEKRELIRMMENLGSKAFGVFSQAVSLEFVESSQRGTSPFKDFIECLSRTQAKICLGGNLVADTTGGTGTHAAASVQDEVREDLRDDDIESEGDMVREQIFGPMCDYRFWRAVPLPYFRRIKPKIVDRIQAGQVLAITVSTFARIVSFQVGGRVRKITGSATFHYVIELSLTFTTLG